MNSLGSVSSSSAEQEKRSAFRRVHSEHLMIEQDRQKLSRATQVLELEIRRLDTERDRLSLKLEEKRAALEKLFRELALLEAESRRIKKKMNLLSH